MTLIHHLYLSHNSLGVKLCYYGSKFCDVSLTIASLHSDLTGAIVVGCVQHGVVNVVQPGNTLEYYS